MSHKWCLKRPLSSQGRASFFFLFFVLLVPLFSFSFFLAHLTHMIKNLERLLVHLHLSTMGTKLSVIRFSYKSFENSFRISRPYYQLMNENYLVCKKRVRFSNYGHLNCMLAIHYFSFWEPVLTEERINYWFFFTSPAPSLSRGSEITIIWPLPIQWL